MTKTKVMVFGCSCVVFAAGLAGGITLDRVKSRPRRRSWIGNELDLTPAQREQMHKTWSGVLSASRMQLREQKEALRKERDQLVRALLTEEQLAQYAEVMEAYEQKTAALAAERRKAFEEAVERTRQILTERQREKYEELLKQRGGWNRRHGRPGMGAPGPGPKAPPHSGDRRHAAPVSGAH